MVIIQLGLTSKNWEVIIMKKIVIRELSIWILATTAGLLLALIISRATLAYSKSIQGEIAQNVIRFHVIANSNTPIDQSLKNTVRDGILDRYKNKINPEATIEDTRAFLVAHLEDIQLYASRIVYDEGFSYPVKVTIDKVFFPTRVYGGMSFPAGEYEALRIVIGEGYGSNWWCVMFPPLCHVEGVMHISAHVYTDTHEYTLLSNLLSDETYELINHSQDDIGIVVRFKVVEWWQERMHNESPNPTMYVLR